MSLELPRLDDRSFQGLVDEAKGLIPEYCPEWTNHNVGDPGVALIELFAYMTDITLYRINQLPDRMYSVLLNLMGVERRPATAAEADIRFWFAALDPDGERELTIPRNSVIASERGPDGSEIKFATNIEVKVEAAELEAFLTTEVDQDDPAKRAVGDNQIESFDSEGDKVVCFNSLERDDAFYLGFKNPLARAIIQLDIEATAEGTGIRPKDPPFEWQAFNGVWERCTQLEDSTGGLNRNGAIKIQMPDRHDASTVGAHRLYWVRAILTEGKSDNSSGIGIYQASPELRSLTVGTVGAVVPSSHQDTIVGPTFLGHSDGTPGQVFELQPNILTRDDTHRVEVRSSTLTDDEVVWTEVDDFGSSEPDDQHVVWEAVDGRIRFGPRVGENLGRPRLRGKIPPKGAEVWVTGYRTGGGAAGNVPHGHLRRQHVAIDRVERVLNLAASGGSDAESVDGLKESGPNWLRAGGRAVTGDDYEEVARRGAETAARIRCSPPAAPGQPIRLLTVPSGERDPQTLRIDDLAIDKRIVRDVRRALEPVRMIGAEIEVTTPYYQGVSIAARVRADRTPGQSLSEIREAVENALYRFVDPLKGGHDGTGWHFDTDLTTRDINELILDVEGVHRVDDVAMFEVDLRGGPQGAGKRIGAALGVVPLGDDSLFLSFEHQVVVLDGDD